MSVSLAELRAQMEELFVIIDVNRNGRLEKQEVRDFSLQLHDQQKPGEPFDEQGFEEHFENMDKNDDGTISKMELLNSLCERA